MARRLLPIALALLSLRLGCAQQPALPTPQSESQSKPGRYVPELHGGTRGRYMPDYSGKYRHMHKPYDGGYGDRGVPYANLLPDIGSIGIYRKAQEPEGFTLGPRDHLRFMIDFNFNGTGWQIIQFDWLRDGEGEDGAPAQPQYNYINENKLWETEMESEVATAQAYDYEQPGSQRDAGPVEQDYSAEKEPEEEHEHHQQQQMTHVHLDGEYDQQDYQVTYSSSPLEQGHTDAKGNTNTRQDSKDIQNAISEVLEYIQQHILPTL